MQDVYTYIQSLGAIISFTTSLIISYIVLKKDYRYSLNILFAGAVISMGLTTLFLFASNIYPILYNDNGPSYILSLSYQFLVFSLLLFLVCLLFINFGKSVFRSPVLYVYLVICLIASFYVLWFTEPFHTVAVGDVSSSSLFKVVIYSILVSAYLLTLFLTLYVYRKLQGQVKSNLGLFLVGWLIGGLALVLNVLGDYAHILDALTQVVLTVAMIVIFMSFNRESERREHPQ